MLFSLNGTITRQAIDFSFNIAVIIFQLINYQVIFYRCKHLISRNKRPRLHFCTSWIKAESEYHLIIWMVAVWKNCTIFVLYFLALNVLLFSNKLIAPCDPEIFYNSFMNFFFKTLFHPLHLGNKTVSHYISCLFTRKKRKRNKMLAEIIKSSLISFIWCERYVRPPLSGKRSLICH